MKRLLMLIGVSLGLLGCTEPEIPFRKEAQTGRWYQQAQVERGQQVYRQNCAVCHGGYGQGGRNWTQPDAQGFYPPPPLNGSAHSWHHPYPVLLSTIREGSRGRMPGWKDQLTGQQIEDVIAYFQHWWPEQAYSRWLQRHQR